MVFVSCYGMFCGFNSDGFVVLLGTKKRENFDYLRI